jgi:hypothetical protein
MNQYYVNYVLGMGGGANKINNYHHFVNLLGNDWLDVFFRFYLYTVEPR